MIYFIKIAPYTLQPKNQDVFSYLSDLTAQRIDPPSEKPESVFVSSPVVFHSTLERAAGCISPQSNQRLVPLSELNEIPFELSEVCTREEWESKGSTVVRHGFLNAFITDSLLLKREQILEGVEKALKKAIEHKDASLLSHSFKMKILEAYIATQGAIRAEPRLLGNYLKPYEHTYFFGGGFEVSGEAVSEWFPKK